MYSIGIDSGSVATKGVLFDGGGIVKKVIIPTGWSPRNASLQVYENLTEGIDKNFGARPLRRTIQNLVEDKLAEEILDGKLNKEKLTKFTVKDGKINQQ